MNTLETLTETVSTQFHSIPVDVLVLVTLVVVGTIYALTRGKHALFSFSLSTFPAAVVTPLFEKLISNTLPELAVFLCIAGALHFFLYHTLRGTTYRDGARHVIETFFLSVSVVGSLLALLLLSITFSDIYSFSPGISKLFTGQLITLLWFAAPFVAYKLCR